MREQREEQETPVRDVDEVDAAIEEEENEQAYEAVSVVEPLPRMFGATWAMEQVYRLVRMAASRDTAVLITRETGTGIELVAGRSTS